MNESVIVAAAVTALLVGGAPVAAARSGPVVAASGTCSDGADWKLKAKKDDGRIEVEWEVDSNRSGQTWRVRVRDNGVRVVATDAVTRPPSGSFSIERRITDRAGDDRIVARARHLASGQLCRGSVTV